MEGFWQTQCNTVQFRVWLVRFYFSCSKSRMEGAWGCYCSCRFCVSCSWWSLSFSTAHQPQLVLLPPHLAVGFAAPSTKPSGWWQKFQEWQTWKPHYTMRWPWAEADILLFCFCKGKALSRTARCQHVAGAQSCSCNSRRLGQGEVADWTSKTSPKEWLELKKSRSLPWKVTQTLVLTGSHIVWANCFYHFLRDGFEVFEVLFWEYPEALWHWEVSDVVFVMVRVRSIWGGGCGTMVLQNFSTFFNNKVNQNWVNPRCCMRHQRLTYLWHTVMLIFSYDWVLV